MRTRRPSLLLLLALLGACSTAERDPTDGSGAPPAATATNDTTALPAGADAALSRITESPRHAEWVTVETGPSDSVRAWVVYPERSTPAPVVLVVHEIFGLSHWIRSVADQLAAEGFIAIAPDLLTSRQIPAGADGAPDAEVARSEIQTLDRETIHRQLLAVAEYGMALPAALERYGIVGFCWGGTVAFEHVIHSAELGASVVYYGSSPDAERLGEVRAPVLGLYGENDERVNATIPAAQTAMDRSGAEYEVEIYPGAGHGFLRAQEGQGGANMEATRAAWPRTVDWFRVNLDR